ncbi:MAG: NAD(P)H-dependent oxidoreductase [Candidatus Pacebacteria bacterium RIFCSPHIGHO2_02_FULL_46_9]|nr:MAG: NAD(P)H-dependent oxidoreductase [Candidatus Pacebacteria bacterium RIFCSPHIGHO2_02_FULL_46_9]
MNDIIKQLNWRYATKKFDPNFKLSEAQLAELTEVVRLSPSSFGLQPWGFVVVSNPAIRTKLRAAAWGQPQITDASHLFVFCRLSQMNQANIDEYVKAIAEQRGLQTADLAEYSQMMTGSIAGKSAVELIAWMSRQVYIALGVLLTTCAIEKIDACPMEGFDNAKFDEILDLPSKGLASCALCAVGKRAADDSYAALAKVRFPKEKVITFV